MKFVLLAGAGSFIGGTGRYLMSLWMPHRNLTTLPVSTIIVNLAGCFLIGLLYGIAEKGTLNLSWQLFLITGILGGFTTFSAFGYETFQFVRNMQYGYAIMNITISVIGGLIATMAGFGAGRWV